LYFTNASPAAGLLAGPNRRFATAAGLLLVLAAVVPGEAGAVNSLLPPEEPALSAKVPPTTKPVKSARRGKSAVEKATVVTPAPVADKLAPPAPVPAAGADRWDIVIADRTLNAAMARWAAAAGWQLLWELPVDYAVQAHTSVPGRFEDAVTLVVNSMEGAEIPMKAVFYSGNKVLRIMAKGAQ